jgi:hypothetical protein
MANLSAKEFVAERLGHTIGEETPRPKGNHVAAGQATLKLHASPGKGEAFSFLQYIVQERINQGKIGQIA